MAFNPGEFIRDFMAMGHTREEAVAMARDELIMRHQTAKRSTREVNARKDKGEERAPVHLNWGRS